ncbi:nucleotide exchange factor GrpE [Buchnera aphidicola]|uniref:nucleotide exchange factor GrpE n=1 Tax=Buchnera aphidicola TaxID=9 RepID=UPI003463C8FD
MVLKENKNLKRNDQLLKKNKIIKSLKSDLLSLEKKFMSINMNDKKYYNKIKLRLIKETNLIYKFSLEKIISSLLPILDSLDMAFKTISKSKNNIHKISKKLLKNNIFFLNVLSENGVTVIKKKNVIFDPSIHQAMFLKKSSSIKKNYVIEIFQKGYFLHNRLLRAAMVSVSN